MSRIVELNALEGGITRLRTKGGANPKWLYDLENGYVLQDGSIQSRPGTTDEIILPAGTKGLCTFDGGLVVFSNAAKTVPAGVTCEVITHPTLPAQELLDIHFAGPFLGYLYVVAEFADGEVCHYWLQRRDAWKANTSYTAGDVVEPSVRNGFAYRAHRLGNPATTWAPNVTRALTDVVEPTTANGYQYTVVDTLGSNPRSGTTEPTWPTSEGARVSEDTDLTAPATPGTGTSTTPTDTLPQDVVDRYGDGFGGLSR